MSLESRKKKICSVEGCDKHVHHGQYCKKHYMKFVKRPKDKELIRKLREAEQAESEDSIEIKTKEKTRRYTPQQMEQLFLTPCTTKKDFKNFVKFFFGLYLPDQSVSRYSDSNPLDALWEVYDICVNKNNPNKINEIIFLASRGSGKTLAMALAELLILLHDQRDVVHVGAIMAQAKRCYEYQQRFLLSERLKKIVSPPKTPDEFKILFSSTMEKSKFNVKGQVISLEVLPCTLKACLTEDAKVITKDGIKPIGSILPGDFIDSPNGFVKVIQNDADYKECIEVQLENGTIIKGTCDHKIWTNNGWVELQALTDEHEILSLEST